MNVFLSIRKPELTNRAIGRGMGRVISLGDRPSLDLILLSASVVTASTGAGWWIPPCRRRRNRRSSLPLRPRRPLSLPRRRFREAKAVRPRARADRRDQATAAGMSSLRHRLEAGTKRIKQAWDRARTTPGRRVRQTAPPSGYQTYQAGGPQGQNYARGYGQQGGYGGPAGRRWELRRRWRRQLWRWGQQLRRRRLRLRGRPPALSRMRTSILSASSRHPRAVHHPPPRCGARRACFVGPEKDGRQGLKERSFRHSRGSYRESSACEFNDFWIPACAGMTCSGPDWDSSDTPPETARQLGSLIRPGGWGNILQGIFLPGSGAAGNRNLEEPLFFDLYGILPYTGISRNGRQPC